MRGYFGIGQLSAAEKSDILDQHKSVYNGYQTMQPQVSNTQPLTVYDFAGDKEGLVVNNKGEVKKYTNMGINEQVELEEGNMCEQCGGTMKEDVCEQCGSGKMEEGMGETCEQCGGTMKEDVCEQCGSGKMEEETGHLDDIYNQEDLNPTAGFDYIQGSSNDVDTFEGMHKKLYKESDIEYPGMDDGEELSPSYDSDGNFLGMVTPSGNMDDSDFQDYESSYTKDGVEDPDNENDGYEDLNASEVTDGELDEYDADDMDVSDVKPAYDFESDGPGDVYPVNEFEDDDIKEYEPMESAFAEDDLEEGDIYGDAEFNEIDVSGVQGIYGAMDRAYDFDSDGPGKAGPYQEFSYESELEEEFKEVDEDLKESFLIQKNKITEMFNRFNKYN